MAVSATILAGAIIGGSVYQGVQANNAQKDAKKAQEEQSQKQDALLKEAKDKSAQDQALLESNATRDAARNKQKNQAMAAMGRQSTILTSPIGVTTPSTGTSKTIIGA